MRGMIRSTIVVLLGVALTLVTVQAAFAGWFWNAHLDVDGSVVRLVWSVDDELNPDTYRANLTLEHPKGIDASVVSTLTDQETVHVRQSPRLQVTEAGIEVIATFKVVALNGSDPGEVTASVVADGVVLASETGDVRESIVIRTTLPDSEKSNE